MYLFNSLSMRLDSDEVFAVVIQPEAREGKEFDQKKSISEQVEAGALEVVSKYQLAHRQGILDEGSLFASEEECKKFFLEFFSK